MTYNYYLNFNQTCNKIAIKLYLREKKQTFVMHTGEFIEGKAGLSLNEVAKKYWDSKAKIVKSNYIGSPELNEYLISFKNNVMSFIRKLKTENQNISFKDIQKAIIESNKPKTANDFFSVYNDFILLRKNEVRPLTTQKFKTLLNILNDFQTAAKYKIEFATLNLLFKDKFFNYLVETKKNSQNTIAKYFDLLRTFLLWATERKINDNLEFKKFKVKTVPTDIVYLTEIELDRLYNYDFSNALKFDRVRDVFCFLCFTGQRWGDVESFKFSDVRNTEWYLAAAEKTMQFNKIPLQDRALAIIDKYQKQGLSKLPTISNAKTNDYLKDVCKIVGINDIMTYIEFVGSERIETTYKKYELIGTHTGRRSFVTLSLEKGMRAETLMQITGHKDWKSFKKYIKITENIKIKAVNEIWNDNQNKITKIA